MKKLLDISFVFILTLLILFFIKSFNKRLHQEKELKRFDQISSILVHENKIESK